jgi:hypothetical protein
LIVCIHSRHYLIEKNTPQCTYSWVTSLFLYSKVPSKGGTKFERGGIFVLSLPRSN